MKVLLKQIRNEYNKNMKIKLYLIGQEDIGDEYAPLGLAYLAGYVRLKIKDIQIKILDQIQKKKIIKIIKKDKPEFIGFTSVSANYSKINKLAGELKKISQGSYLIIGGVHITVSPESFNKSNFDIAVIGEGEITLEELLNAYLKDKDKFEKKLKSVRGILFGKNPVFYTGKRELIEDLSILPPPAWDLLNMKYYSLPKIARNMRREIGIMTSRGCPYNCIYCCSNRWERKVRYIPEKKVVEEMELLNKRYHINCIFIQDDIFCLDKQRIKSIIDLLKEKNLLGKIEFIVNGRANLFDEEITQLFKELGVIKIVFGFESGSEKILNQIKKGTVSVKDNIRSCNICKKYNFPFVGYIMLGNPNETEGDMMMSYNFAKNNLKGGLTVFQTVAFPGTEIWKYALKNKIIDKDYYDTPMRARQDSYDFNFILSKEISKEKFKEIYFKIKSLQDEPKVKFNISKLLLLIIWLFNLYFVYIKFTHVINKLKINKKRDNEDKF